MPFELFYETETASLDSNIKKGSKECYKEWYDQNVISFEITDTTTLFKAEGRLFSNCYTSNPCDTYTGPIRP